MKNHEELKHINIAFILTAILLVLLFALSSCNVKYSATTKVNQYTKVVDSDLYLFTSIIYENNVLSFNADKLTGLEADSILSITSMRYTEGMTVIDGLIKLKSNDNEN